MLLGAGALFAASVVPAAAVEFGAPDFPNYMSRIGAVSCDWQYDSNYRACPDPQTPPKPVESAKEKAKGKSK
jgi:hypothetical protein